MRRERGANTASPPYLSDTLDLILLLNGKTVGRALRSVDNLISQALRDGLDVTESSLACLDTNDNG